MKSVSYSFLRLVLALGVVTFQNRHADASEFPERECCDPVFPLAAPPASTTPYPSAATPTGRSGPNVKTAVAILNCLLARQLCFEDPSCAAILEIIPRVCGAELVACSTVTVTKCQAALRTLQAFPFFRPTCLCREPHVDPECNSFRDFLFDHPCIFVIKKEKDPYPVDALPTCNHALLVCQNERKCIKLYEDFKVNCKVRDQICRMEDREMCHEAWTKLRLSPMFGCICPNNHMKRRCDRIFSMVNHNPCVDVLPGSLDLSGTDSALYPYDPDQDDFQEFWFPQATSLYPYFLFPPDTMRHRPHYPSFDPATGTGTHSDTQQSVEDTLDTPLDYDESDDQLTSSSSGSISVKVISSENASSFDVIELQLENPLVGIRGGATQKDVAQRQELHGIPANDNNILEEDGEPRRTIFSHSHPANPMLHSSAEEAEMARNFSFQSTCHLALEMCIANRSCHIHLQPALHYCDKSRCDRDICMEKLQSFYRTADLRWGLEVAFCLCKKSDNKADECLVAQERLHPVCAQRVEGTQMPTCHTLAEECREDVLCRDRLEYYEQSCAVDSVTKKCAGPPSECRKAMLGILGTELRSTCACKGTDFTQLYDCLGWQRLLWVNPCVVESQKDFHTKRSTEYGFSTIAPAKTIATTEWSIAGSDAGNGYESFRGLTVGEADDSEGDSADVDADDDAGGKIGYGTGYGDIYRALPENALPEVPFPTRPLNPMLIPAGPAPTSPGPDPASATGGGFVFNQWLTSEVAPTVSTLSVSVLPTAQPTTTPTPRFCLVQRPNKDDQLIPEGYGRRLYRDDEPDCSELCQCSDGEQLVCNTVCIERAPCKTDFAFYNHAAPAYQAYRGRCLCYSGKFICMRPSPESYHLPQGVFLFLGYSETDEALLRPHSNLTVRDVVGSLQDVIRTESACNLILLNVTNENVILMARFGRNEEEEENPSLDSLVREKEECAGPLQDISNKINTHHPELHSHLLLSILKMAEVEVKVPEANRAGLRASKAMGAMRSAVSAAAALLLGQLLGNGAAS